MVSVPSGQMAKQGFPYSPAAFAHTTVGANDEFTVKQCFLFHLVLGTDTPAMYKVFLLYCREKYTVFKELRLENEKVCFIIDLAKLEFLTLRVDSSNKLGKKLSCSA